jgi:hypothetical protein
MEGLQKGDLRELEARYRNRGVEIAGRLSLRADDALHFLDELQGMKIGVLGLFLWYYGEGDTDKSNLLEYIGEPDYGHFLGDPQYVEKSISAAKDFISTELPPEIEYIGVVYPR